MEKRVEIINIDPDQLHNLEDIEYHDVEIKKRPSEALTRIGLFNSEEFIQSVLTSNSEKIETDLTNISLDFRVKKIINFIENS